MTGERPSQFSSTSEACSWWDSDQASNVDCFTLSESMIQEIRTAAQYQKSRSEAGRAYTGLGAIDVSVVKEEIHRMQSHEYMSKVLQDRRLQEYVTLRPMMSPGVESSVEDPASTSAANQFMVFNEQLFIDLVSLVTSVRCLRERLFYLQTAQEMVANAIKDVNPLPSSS